MPIATADPGTDSFALAPLDHSRFDLAASDGTRDTAESKQITLLGGARQAWVWTRTCRARYRTPS
ncbi:hypothetical protein [Rhodococcus jostii]|uniref:hypothetical protein n=1 Tax=Rhodococcus jostii TaxID=132919 RepID=UPI0036358748